MRMLLRGLGVIVGIVGYAVQTFSMPALNHTPIGSRCGGCRYDGPYMGNADDK